MRRPSLKISLLFFSILALISCKKPNSGEDTVHEISSESIQLGTQTLCSPAQRLAPHSGAVDKLYNLPTIVTAFGFLKGTWACALTSDYHQDGMFGEWFAITLQDDCLTNGSLWKIKSLSHPNDNSTLMELSQIGRDPEQVLHINAGSWVTIQTLTQVSGLTLYSCQDPPN
jgi:hypothetical protein